jgi:hypothetical protein
MVSRRSLLIDAAVFVLLFIPTALFPFFVQGTVWHNPMIWAFVVAIPPAVYFGIRKRKNWRKIITGSFVFGILFGSILEYVAHVTGAWQVPETVFPFRILGASTFEAFIGYIPMTLFVLVFYEHFFDQNIKHKVSPHIRRAVIPALLVWGLIIFMHFTDPSRLIFSHAYVKMGLVAIIPTIVQSVRSPRLFAKYAKLSVSLFFIFLILEIIGVHSGFWTYAETGYIGMATILGATFPIEEIIFWCFFFPATIAAYYEEFVDDGR